MRLGCAGGRRDYGTGFVDGRRVIVWRVVNERAGVVNQALECSLAMGRSGVAQLYRTKPVLSVAVTKLLGLRRVLRLLHPRFCGQRASVKLVTLRGQTPIVSSQLSPVNRKGFFCATTLAHMDCVGSLKHALSGSINLRSGSVRWGRAADNSAPLRTYNDRRRRVGALRACKPHCHGAAQLSLVGVLVYPELRRPRAPQAQANSDWS